MGLDTIELVLAAEKCFGVSVPDERAEKTITVEQFARLLFELQAQLAHPSRLKKCFWNSDNWYQSNSKFLLKKFFLKRNLLNI